MMGAHSGKVVHRGKTYVIEFVVVDEPGQPPILGLPSCELLNLIQRVNEMSAHSDRELTQCPALAREFADVFTGLEKLSGEHAIKLVEGAVPSVYAASRLPFKLQEAVFDKLDEMERDGVITPVSEPTDWVSRMVVVRKPNGDVRICIDPSELNKVIKREYFTVPTAEELFSKIGNKARYFCSLDAASGFYQIALNPSSSYLCTFAKPRGRYRFLRFRESYRGLVMCCRRAN